MQPLTSYSLLLPLPSLLTHSNFELQKLHVSKVLDVAQNTTTE